MKISSRLTILVLLVLAAAAGIGLYLTRTSSGVRQARSSLPADERALRTDQQPLDTAQELAPLAHGEEEQKLAADALRLSDHQLDLAFSGQLRAASDQAVRQTPAIRAIQERIDRAQTAIAAGNGRIAEFKAAAARATADRQASLEQQTEILQAEVSLHQDELADAQQDLVRAGGDERSRIQELLDQHEAVEHSSQQVQITRSAGNGAAPANNILAEASAWSASRSRQQQIAGAQQEALRLATALSSDHVRLDQQVDREKAARTAGRSAAGNAAQPAEPGAGGDDLKSLHKLSDDEKSLAEFDRRIQDLQQLAATYGQWNALAEVQTRQALHRLIQGFLWILFVMLAALAIQRFGDHSLERLKLQRTQQATLRAVIHFVVQTFAVLAIILLIFGAPSQFTTILGLAGAGLTVALKDFIVAFLGWFVLMGRNGIRVGDWVEINGVLGEVVEISMLRTVLLETGNWAEAGLPTGRQVAFLNGYAVEGQYFNFTTSGQWLWDELQVAISGGANPYPLIEEIRAMVEKETAGYAHEAGQDWQRVASRYHVQTRSLEPALDLRPSPDGVLVKVRYVTRASERSEVRSRLNHALVELLHGRKDKLPEAEVLTAGSHSA